MNTISARVMARARKARRAESPDASGMTGLETDLNEAAGIGAPYWMLCERVKLSDMKGPASGRR